MSDILPRPGEAIGVTLLLAAIERSGFDVSPCRNCGEPVVCIPDGLAMCKDCAEKASKEG